MVMFDDTINLIRNEIGDEGAKYLAEGLKSNNTLTTINLEYNEIGNEGAKYLALSWNIIKLATKG